MKFSFILLILFKIVTNLSASEPIYKLKGNLSLALIVNNCTNNSAAFSEQSLVTSTIWIVQRVNFLKILKPLNLGLNIYKACNTSEYYKIAFDLYQNHEELPIGIIDDNNNNNKKSYENLVKFSELLNIRVKVLKKNFIDLVKAAVATLSAFNWNYLSVLAPEEKFLNEFYSQTKEEFCLKNCFVYKNYNFSSLDYLDVFVREKQVNEASNDSLIFFGNKSAIELNANKFRNYQILFVPTDGSVPKDLPNNSYVIIPPHELLSEKIENQLNIHPTPLIFETANPILHYVQNVADFIKNECNNTIYKINCFRNKFTTKHYPRSLTNNKILEILQLEPLKQFFVYNVYFVEETNENVTDLLVKNSFFLPYTKVLSYNIFDGNVSVMEEINGTEFVKENRRICFWENKKKSILKTVDSFLIRTDSWVYAVLSLSLLGVLFCLAILIFLLCSICKHEILEGNPFLTIALLFSTILIFSAVLPFAVEENRHYKDILCIAKSLSVTLSYAFAFSLLLARTILLASASKEIGFMSHIAGTVQSFLTLFIFGVQAALSLQTTNHCRNFTSGYTFFYLNGYNTMLLLLLICLCPMIYHVERNYREGKYFSITITLILILWIIWIPFYLFLDNKHREAVLCFGLVSTGAALLVGIFIPRTYLMTIAAARDRITSTFPSLATATSNIDIYRTNPQPIYDCVNVAAINAITVARAGISSQQQTLQQPDLYSCPALPDSEEFDFRCDSPVNNDKVTRF